jgi:hypothetical protein
VPRAAFRRSLEQAEARFAGAAIRLRERAYVPELVLSETPRAVVLLARVHVPVVERVVLKLARAPESLTRERTALAALAAAEVPGNVHFAMRLPQIVASGVAELDGTATPALAFRARAGWLHTVRDVAAAHPTGIDGRHVVWIWRRILEVVGFAHRAGWVHGRLEAEHLVVAARDHGVLVVGWSGAEPTRGSDDPRVRADLARVATVLSALAPLPEPLAPLLRASIDGAHADAWELGEAVGHAARQAYGPPAFHPLSLPPFRR